MELSKTPRILLFDIETFPNQAFVWGKYEQNVIRFIKQSCIATFSAKWLGEKKIISKGLNDYKGYKPGSYDDKEIVKELWNLLNEADIVIAHHGDAFDIKRCNERFIVHGFLPPSPYKTIDTKKIFSDVAKFNSNKLDDLGQSLGLGRKIKTDFDLWEGCINGSKKHWDLMKEYNNEDVLLLEKVYLRVLPWIKNHPNLTLWTQGNCPKCGGFNIQKRGFQIATTRVYQRFQCNDCGGWGRFVRCEKGKNSNTTNIID